MAEIGIAELTTNFSGDIITPDDKAYDAARVTYAVKNAKPAIIAQATSNEDIAAAIRFAKDSQLQLSVRSGGHSVAGFSTNNDGLVLDLSNMDSVDVLDEKAGLVRLGSGALWGNVAAQLDGHGLAISSGDTKGVAVGGLTLGGGMGWMLRKYGYAIDSLVAAEVVLADGSVVRADESENSDLFWALRGGGGNFGVVSSFEFKAHRQGKVVASILTYDASDVHKIITGWRDHLRTTPEDLTSFMMCGPPGLMGPDPKVIIMSCYASDDLAHANAFIDPLRQLGNLLNDDTAIKNYADVLQTGPPPPEGAKLIIKNMFIKTLSDELVNTLGDICGKQGSPIVQLRMLGGGVDKIDPSATAIPHRGNEAFMFASFPVPLDATKEQTDERLQAWNKLARYSTGTYSNFLSTNTSDDVAGIYPKATYERLAKIKHKYDPENIFSHNFNIKPAKD